MDLKGLPVTGFANVHSQSASLGMVANKDKAPSNKGTCRAFGPQVVRGRADSHMSSCINGWLCLFKIVVSTIVLLLTTGCASLIGEGKQPVSVQAVC
jgi:hypothetical protein